MKKTFLILYLLLAGFAPPASAADPWTPEEVQWAQTLASATLIDYGQTRGIAKGAGWEANPLLGRHPTLGRVNVYFGLVGLGSFLIADNLSGAARLNFLRIASYVELGVVAHNAYLGYRVSF